MTLYQYNENPNTFVRFARKIYHPIGFKKGYNFILFFIFAGALFGFCLARLQYLSIDGVFKNGAAPGEWFYYSRTFYKVGIALHLACVIPAGILMVPQFIPIIRYKALLFHRINGYALLFLIIGGNIGALMIARWSFGGTMATQGLVGTLAIATLGSASLSYYNIKRLQIDQHRAWMLRTWSYLGVIVTMRIVMIIAGLIISTRGNYYIAIPCQQIDFMGGNATVYPNCAADPNAHTAVKADILTATSTEQAAAALYESFGMAGWISLMLHIIGVELYLKLTPAEGERLRKVSYERQLERGFSHPGSSGLTVDRLGDAEPWMPPTSKGEDDGESTKQDHGADKTARPGSHLGWS